MNDIDFDYERSRCWAPQEAGMSDRARKAAEDELVGLFEWHRLSKPPVDAMRDRVRKILERHYPEPAPTAPSDAVPVRCAEEDPEGYNARIVTPVTAPAAEPETPTLNDLLEKARTHVMTPEEKAAQRQSWARGEAAMGESTVKAEPEAGAREADIREQIGRIMHESWSKTKRARGFHGPNDPCHRWGTCPEFEHCDEFHADLIPWEQLPEKQKDINRHAFDAVLDSGILVEARAHREREERRRQLLKHAVTVIGLTPDTCELCAAIRKEVEGGCATNR